MVLVIGATGFLGTAVCEMLHKRGIPHVKFGHNEEGAKYLFDLEKEGSLERCIDESNEHIDTIINCVAFSGGLKFAMSSPAELYNKNMKMILNLYEGAKNRGIERIINPISNCAYPAKARLFNEDEFWDGPLHESVLVYGSSRKSSYIASYAYCKQYNISTTNLILSNLYGKGDHYSEEKSHALGAAMRKTYDALVGDKPEVVIWGTGEPVREWLYIADAADAMVSALNWYNETGYDLYNIGTGQGVSINYMYSLIAKFMGYHGTFVHDLTKPDGAWHKTVNGQTVRKKFGWGPSMTFESGVSVTVADFLSNILD